MSSFLKRKQRHPSALQTLVSSHSSGVISTEAYILYAGDVTYEMCVTHLAANRNNMLSLGSSPAIHPIYKIDAPPKQGNHTAGFTEAARTEDAHRKSLVASKGIGELLS